MAGLLANHKLASLKQCVSAGEALPDATRQLFKQASGIEIIDGIGATEMIHIFISHAPERVRRGATGYAIPGYQARTDDMIISAGYNIAGPEVEAALLAHPAVSECGVVGVSDPERGQIVKAWVVLKPGYAGSAPMVNDLQEFVKGIIAPYKYPRAIQFVASLPRTETGKLQRFKLRLSG